MPRLDNAQELTALRESLQAAQQIAAARETMISIGMGTCGQAAGAGDTYQAIQDELSRHSIQARVRAVGCIGMCVNEPLVDIQLPGQPRVTYINVTPSRVPRIIAEHVLQGQVVQEWVLAKVPLDW
jgi:NADP-reducing hydrogenase subunit HndB